MTPLLSTFIHWAPQCLAVLQVSLALRDVRKAKQHAQELKRLSKDMGEHQIRGICTRLETLVAAGRFTEASELLMHLKESYLGSVKRLQGASSPIERDKYKLN